MSTVVSWVAAPRRSPRTPLVGLGLVLPVLLFTGCASLGPDSAGAREVTQTFLSALEEGDGGRACAQLNDSAREAVEEQTGAACAEGVLELGIDADVSPAPAQVFSRAAFVETGGEAVFLTPGDDGWLIRAAGCTPVADAPYDCVLDGS
jgi:hypothetical protein